MMYELLPFTKEESDAALKAKTGNIHKSKEQAFRSAKIAALKAASAFDDGNLTALAVSEPRQFAKTIVITVDLIHDGKLVQITLEV